MRNYSKEFKDKALKLSDEIGVQRAAAQFGFPYYLLADWRSNRRRRLKNPPKPLTEAEAGLPGSKSWSAKMKSSEGQMTP